MTRVPNEALRFVIDRKDRLFAEVAAVYQELPALGSGRGPGEPKHGHHCHQQEAGEEKWDHSDLLAFIQEA